MGTELEKYSNLVIKLDSERKLLDEFRIHLDCLYNKSKETNEKINKINESNINLKNEITKIINRYLTITNIYLKIFSILFIITSIITVGILSNLNFIVMLLFSITSPIICIFIRVYIADLLKEKYKNRNKQIGSLNALINENNIILEQLKNEATTLTNNIREISNLYNKQQRKVQLIQTIITRKNNYYTNNIDTYGCYKKIKTRK